MNCTQERNLSWKQESSKFMFSDWMGKARIYKRGRGKVNNNKGGGRAGCY